VVAQWTDSACSHGSATAALEPVPGTVTTRGHPAPAEVSSTRPTLVSKVALVSGKSARAKASEHDCRTARWPRGFFVYGRHCVSVSGGSWFV